jgi:hypothetical protein
MALGPEGSPGTIPLSGGSPSNILMNLFQGLRNGSSAETQIYGGDVTLPRSPIVHPIRSNQLNMFPKVYLLKV